MYGYVDKNGIAQVGFRQVVLSNRYGVPLAPPVFSANWTGSNRRAVEQDPQSLFVYQEDNHTDPRSVRS